MCVPAFEGDCECESEYFLSLLPGGVTRACSHSLYHQVNCTLTDLNLSGNYVGPEGGKAFGEALKVTTGPCALCGYIRIRSSHERIKRVHGVYVCLHVCVCVCACVCGEREGGRGTDKERTCVRMCVCVCVCVCIQVRDQCPLLCSFLFQLELTFLNFRLFYSNLS